MVLRGGFLQLGVQGAMDEQPVFSEWFSGRGFAFIRGKDLCPELPLAEKRPSGHYCRKFPLVK
jgi:hypothetical protein